MNYGTDIRRGDVYYIKKGLGDGWELQSGRPAIVISADSVNRENTTVEVVYLTTQPKKQSVTHIEVKSTNKTSTALCEQVQTVDTDKVGTYMCSLTDDEMSRVMTGVMFGMAVDAFSDNELEKEVAELKAKLDDNEKFYRTMIERLCKE